MSRKLTNLIFAVFCFFMSFIMRAPASKGLFIVAGIGASIGVLVSVLVERSGRDSVPSEAVGSKKPHP